MKKVDRNKKNIEIQLAVQFMEYDFEFAKKCIESEITILKRFNIWLLDKLADKYYEEISKK